MATTPPSSRENGHDAVPRATTRYLPNDVSRTACDDGGVVATSASHCHQPIVNRKSINRKFYQLPSINYRLLKRKGFRFSLSVPSVVNLNPQRTTHNVHPQRPHAIVNRKSKNRKLCYPLQSTNYHLSTTNCNRNRDPSPPYSVRRKN